MFLPLHPSPPQPRPFTVRYYNVFCANFKNTSCCSITAPKIILFEIGPNYIRHNVVYTMIYYFFLFKHILFKVCIMYKNATKWNSFDAKSICLIILQHKTELHCIISSINKAKLLDLYKYYFDYYWVQKELIKLWDKIIINRRALIRVA